MARRSFLSAGSGARRHVGFMAAAAALSAFALSPLFAGPVAAAAAVAEIEVGAVTSAFEAPDGTPPGAVPSVLTSVGRTVSVHVDFFDADGFAASFGKETEIALTTSAGGGSVVRTVDKDATSVDLTSGAFTSAANKVTVTVSVPSSRGKTAIAPVTSQTVFDVLQFFNVTTPGTGPFVQKVGKTGLGCPDVTETDPLCATVSLPQGAVGDVVLGSGKCDGSPYTTCTDVRAFVLELLGDLSSYTPESPATIVLSCDKKYCGRGSIQRNVPLFTQGGNTPLVPLAACTEKGVASPGPACVDYVQSTRDNAGDTHLYVLVTRDLRGSCC